MNKSKQVLKNISRRSPKIIRKILFHFYSNQFNEKRAHSFWTQKSPQGNDPEGYMKPIYRSKLLYSFMPKLKKDVKILEIGCNVGRNLNFLYEKGYSNLFGIEINRHAIDLMKKKYPKVFSKRRIFVGPAENEISKLPYGEFELIFTMATLVHISEESDKIFRDISKRVKKYLITIEDESSLTERHFPRNYKKVFSKYNLMQIKKLKIEKSPDGALDAYIARLFIKANL